MGLLDGVFDPSSNFDLTGVTPAKNLDPAMVHKAALADLISQVNKQPSSYDPSWSDTRIQQAPQAPQASPWTAETVSAPQQPAPFSMAPQQAPAPAQTAPQPQAAPQAPAAQSAQPAPLSMAPHITSAAPAAPLAKPDFIDRLSAFGRGLADNHGILGAIGDAAGAQSPLAIEQQNQTYQALVAKGIDPNVAKAAVLNPQILQQVLPMAFPPKAPAIEKIGPDDRLINTVVGPDGHASATDVTPGGDTLSGKTVQSRQLLASRYGIKPGTMEYNGYVLNGKLPDVVPDHKAIQEADSQVLQSQHLLEDIERAKQLNSQAYAGFAPETRAAIAGNLPGSHPSADATTQFANLVKSTILPGLKSTFPGRITNADLHYMEQLQGDTSLSPQQRADILDRIARRAAELHGEKMQDAKALREGNYYKPDGQGAATQPAGQQQAQAAPVKVSTFEEALKLPSGTPFMTPDGRMKVRP